MTDRRVKLYRFDTQIPNVLHSRYMTGTQKVILLILLTEMKTENKIIRFDRENLKLENTLFPHNQHLLLYILLQFVSTLEPQGT